MFAAIRRASSRVSNLAQIIDAGSSWLAAAVSV
jgi:hypothetical protein